MCCGIVWRGDMTIEAGYMTCLLEQRTEGNYAIFLCRTFAR